jgi:hypothetical protein
MRIHPCWLLLVLISSSNAFGQTVPVYRGSFGVAAGGGILMSSGIAGAPIDGAGPAIVGSAGVNVGRGNAVEGEVGWLRVSDPSSYKSSPYQNTVQQLQIDGLLRHSFPGQPYDVDFVAGLGVVRRNYSELVTGSGTQTGLNVEAGVDVTKWWTSAGFLIRLRASVARQASPYGGGGYSPPFGAVFMFGGGFRTRF